MQVVHNPNNRPGVRQFINHKCKPNCYVQIVGDTPSGIKQAPPLNKAIPKSIDKAVATGWRDHPQILATMYAIDQAGYQVKSAEGQMLPFEPPG